MNNILTNFKIYFNETLNQTIEFNSNSIIEKFLDVHEQNNDNNKNLLKNWLENTYEHKYIKKIISNKKFQEIIIHNNNYAQLIDNDFYRIKLDNISPDDYQLSLEIFCLKNNISWNFSTPYASFFTSIDNRLFRATLTHHSITPVGSSKLFLRAIEKSDFNLNCFIKEDSIIKLKNIIKDKSNTIICGPTGSGKTTLMRSMLKEINNHEHLVILEDTHELYLNRENTSFLLSCKRRDLSLEKFCSYSLRMRPSRMALGEIRSQEVIPFFMMMNAGHNGLISTIHANSAVESIDRLALLFCLNNKRQGIDLEYVIKMICGCIDKIIMVDNHKVVEIIKVLGSEKEHPYFEYDYKAS